MLLYNGFMSTNTCLYFSSVCPLLFQTLMNTVCYMESYARRSNLWQVSLLNQKRVPSGFHCISVNDAERSYFLAFDLFDKLRVQIPTEQPFLYGLEILFSSMSVVLACSE